jgi:hypothetical protein
MATPEVFSKRIGRIAFKIEGNVEKGMRKAVLAIDNALTSTTPVDTGRARSNWLPNLDVAATGTTENTTPNKAAVANTVARFKIDKNVAIHLTNNLPYIVKLDKGSSQQQPAGFTRRAVLAGLAAVKSIKLLKK